jgi:hypothetical protein
LRVLILKRKSNELALAEKPWDRMWGDILSSDFPNGNDVLQMDIDGASGTSTHIVEEGIEWWATHSMPSIDPLLDSQVTPPEGVSTDGPVNESTIICYGMVGTSSYCHQP